MIFNLASVYHKACAASSAAYNEWHPVHPGKAIATLSVETVGIDAQVAIVDYRNIRFIAFRGTEPTEIRDIATDLRGYPWMCFPWGLMHRGFLRATKSLLRQIKPYLATDKAIIATGHSMGGAMAMILPLLVKGVDRVITFGAPPCMRLFAAYPTRLMRIENNFDPIPHLRIWKFFKHVGGVLWLDDNGKAFDKRDSMLKEFTWFIQVAIKSDDLIKLAGGDHPLHVYDKKLKDAKYAGNVAKPNPG